MKRTFFAILLMILTLSACASTAAPTAMPGGYGGGMDSGYAAEPAPMSVVPEEPLMRYSVTSGDSTANEGRADVDTLERMVIENANLSLVVTEPHARAAEIGELAKSLGGFVVSTNLYETNLPNGGKAPQGDMVIRIPSEKLDEALAAIKEGAVEVRAENRSGQDVTQEYTDLESRLRNLEATEKQLTRIMEQAEKTEDVMSVFTQLSQVREQIEIIKGQMKYYEQSVALSSVSIQLLAEETVRPLEIGPWKPEGEARDAAQSLINFLQDFASLIIWLVILYIPAGLLILALIFTLIFVVWKVGGWLWRRMFGKRSSKPVAAQVVEKSEEKK